LKLSGIGLVIDAPVDLLELGRQTVQTRAQNYLQKYKILERIKIE
jgi:ABC-type histidine transport system ATPase subunit